jgi:glycine/D-amino acid oxidase-like deaminating enzyme
MKHVGVELIEGADVSALTLEDGRVTGVVSAGTCFDAGVVIVAAGSWSSQLLEPLGLSVKVIPARGQMIAVRSNGCTIKRVLHSSKVYLVPRNDGRILIGATVEYEGFHKALTAGAINQLLSAAVELMPSIANFEVIETWCGLRPDTIDHLPLIGASGVDNLMLTTGHFRNGILLAPITADLMSQLVVQGRVPDQIRPFGIERFDQTTESKWREMPDR